MSKVHLNQQIQALENDLKAMSQAYQQQQLVVFSLVKQAGMVSIPREVMRSIKPTDNLQVVVHADSVDIVFQDGDDVDNSLERAGKAEEAPSSVAVVETPKDIIVAGAMPSASTEKPGLIIASR